MGSLKGFSFKLEFILAWCPPKKIKRVQDKAAEIKKEELRKKN